MVLIHARCVDTMRFKLLNMVRKDETIKFSGKTIVKGLNRRCKCLYFASLAPETI